MAILDSELTLISTECLIQNTIDPAAADCNVLTVTQNPCITMYQNMSPRKLCEITSNCLHIYVPFQSCCGISIGFTCQYKCFTDYRQHIPPVYTGPGVPHAPHVTCMLLPYCHVLTIEQ